MERRHPCLQYSQYEFKPEAKKFASGNFYNSIFQNHYLSIPTFFPNFAMRNLYKI